jgi:hypothetical protein
MTVNPNGANGSISDPREQVCWDLYVKNNLQNAYECAIKAKYAKDTARNITTNDWFKERLGKLKRKEMLSKAEKLLDKTLTYSSENDEGKVQTDLLRIQTDVAKHITSTLGKNDGYSNKGEDAQDKIADKITVISFRDRDETNPNK